jgi:hypothetical protein
MWQVTAKLNAIFATLTLPSLIVKSSAATLGPLLPSSQCVVQCRVLHPSPLFVLSTIQLPASSTPTSSNCPGLSTLASCCVLHRPITSRSVIRPPPIFVLFAARSPCIACHPLVSRSLPSLLSHCPPPACLASSTAPSPHVIHCLFLPHILYLDSIVAFPLLLSPPPCNCPS